MSAPDRSCHPIYQFGTAALSQAKSFKLARKTTHGSCFGSKIAIIGERHAGTFPAQCVHDPGQIFARDEQVLIKTYPRRMSAYSLKQAI